MSDTKHDPALAGLSLRERLDALTGRALDTGASAAATVKREAALAAAEATLKGAWGAIRGVVSEEADAMLRHSERALAEAQLSDSERVEKLRGAAAAARAEREARKERAEEALRALKAAKAKGGSAPEKDAPPAAEAPRAKKTL